MKLIVIYLVLATVLSCQGSDSSAPTNEAEEVPHIFKSKELNNALFEYVDKSAASFEGRKIHTVTFSKNDTVEFSGLLAINRYKLLGHIYYKNDLIVFYDISGKGAKSIDLDKIRTDSIIGFTYFEDAEDLYPYDPIYEEYDLKDYQ